MLLVFFFNDTATTEIYTLSLHDALPISGFDPEKTARHLRDEGLLIADPGKLQKQERIIRGGIPGKGRFYALDMRRSEEHTSELQSRQYLVCRLLLEKKKTKTTVLLSTDI